jgi:hypothetical protein
LPITPVNAAALRSQLTWLQPRPLGLKTSAQKQQTWTLYVSLPVCFQLQFSRVPVGYAVALLPLLVDF